MIGAVHVCTHTHSDTHTYQPSTKLFVVDKPHQAGRKYYLLLSITEEIKTEMCTCTR